MNPLTFLALLHDVVVAIVAWVVAYLLRFNFSIPPEHLDHMLQSVGWVVALQGVVFISFGLYRGVWRFASISDLKRIFMAVITASALIIAGLFMLQSGIVIPRSVLILYPL